MLLTLNDLFDVQMPVLFDLFVCYQDIFVRYKDLFSSLTKAALNTLLGVLDQHGGFVEGGQHLIWAARALAAGGGDENEVIAGITKTAFVPKAISDWYNGISKLSSLGDAMEKENDSPDPINCNVCGQKFAPESNIEDHVMRHIKEKGRLDSIFEPTDGEIKSENIGSKQISKNTNQLSYIKRLPCSECGVKTENLESHKLRKHTVTEKTHSCDTCGSKFSSLSILDEHVKINHACCECGLKFKSLNGHKLHKHTEKAHFCDTCGSGFITLSILTEHIKINHTNEIDTTCKECRKKFHSKSALRKHQKIHGDPLAFVCDECGKGFRTKSHLRRHHVIRHSKFTHIICSFEGCNVRLKKEGLRRHTLIHTGERPFECANCDATFPSNNALGRHTLTHSGEKPFKCSQCEKEFSQNCNLKTHEIKHHNDSC